MTIDERARAAATDLLARAEERPMPSVEDLVAPRRSHRPLAFAAIAASILTVVAVGAALLVRDGDETTVSMPGGGAAQQWAPEGTPVTLQVPSTWIEQSPRSGLGHAIGAVGRDGGVVADLFRLVEPVDVRDISIDRAADLQAFGAIEIQSTTTELDGRRAAVHRYRVPGQDPKERFAVTEFDVPMGDWLLIVGVSEKEPTDRSEIIDWVISTIEVRDLTDADTAVTSSIRQPASPLPTPSAVVASTWAPDGFGVTMEVPRGWRDLRPAGVEYAEIRLPAGPVVRVTRMTAAEATQLEADADGANSVLESAVDTIVDDRPARAVRTWRVNDGYPLRTFIDVTLYIELGGGQVLAVGTTEADGGPDQSELLRWIRSTIDLV